MTYAPRYETVYGNAYRETRDLSPADVAKRIRADIARDVKSGVLPRTLKTSVRLSIFSGGWSVRVEIKGGIPLLNPSHVHWQAENPHTVSHYAPPDCQNPHSDACRAVAARLEAIVGAYNYNGSDTMTDYFNVRFYAHVSVDWQAEKAEREAILALPTLTD